MLSKAKFYCPPPNAHKILVGKEFQRIIYFLKLLNYYSKVSLVPL